MLSDFFLRFHSRHKSGVKRNERGEYILEAQRKSNEHGTHAATTTSLTEIKTEKGRRPNVKQKHSTGRAFPFPQKMLGFSDCSAHAHTHTPKSKTKRTRPALLHCLFSFPPPRFSSPTFSQRSFLLASRRDHSAGLSSGVSSGAFIASKLNGLPWMRWNRSRMLSAASSKWVALS